jgi:hypothetical protein
MKTNIVHDSEIRASVETGVIIIKGTLVKLGLDVHARQITVCRQLGDLTPQPPQAFTKERLLGWVKRMLEAGAVVHSCYEAGVMGYTLHRELVALGAKNLVVAPKNSPGRSGKRPMHWTPARWSINSTAGSGATATRSVSCACQRPTRSRRGRKPDCAIISGGCAGWPKRADVAC